MLTNLAKSFAVDENADVVTVHGINPRESARRHDTSVTAIRGRLVLAISSTSAFTILAMESVS